MITMIINILKKRLDNLKMLALILCVLVYLILLSNLVKAPPPSAHTVDGRVFTNGSNGVQNGIPVAVNDTVSGDYVVVYTDAPPDPDVSGSYLATINGNDGDLIIVTSWNSTHYGTNSSNLVSTTTSINVILNITRPSEANVTIIEPLNNSIKNKSIIFNVTANITMLGANGVDCNATISFSNNQTINISSGENLTRILGNISLGNFKLINWSAIGLNEGVSNITVRADCGSDGIKLDKVNSYTVWNITIKNLAPDITRIVITSPIDLVAGDNLILSCNATINDNNTASDINIVNATFYQSSIGSNALDDNNNHYTNSSCLNVSSSVFEANYSCGFKVAYYANNGTWQCNVTAMDYSNITVFSNISDIISELMAIDVSPTIIDYGKLIPLNISLNGTNLTIRNFGNIPINATVRGFAPNESLAYLNLSMTCENGNISNSNQRFSILNGTSFAAMRRLNNESQLINFTLQQRTNDLDFGNDTNTTYWNLEVPTATKGLCNGTILFSAISAT